MKFHCGSFIFLFIALFPMGLNASSQIIWGYGHFPPSIYAQENGKPQGPFADIVKNIFEHAEIEYQAVLLPNRRARKAINDGSVVFAISPLSSLDNPDNFYISPVVVAKIDLRVYWIGNQKAVTQAQDLNLQSVILISSFNYSGLRNYVENSDNNVTVAVNVEDHQRALLALSVKRATYMLGYSAPVKLMQLEMNIQDLHSYPLQQTNMYIVINKSVKNSRQIMDKLEASYAAIYLNNLNSG